MRAAQNRSVEKVVTRSPPISIAIGPPLGRISGAAGNGETSRGRGRRRAGKRGLFAAAVRYGSAKGNYRRHENGRRITPISRRGGGTIAVRPRRGRAAPRRTIISTKRCVRRGGQLARGVAIAGHATAKGGRGRTVAVMGQGRGLAAVFAAPGGVIAVRRRGSGGCNCVTRISRRRLHCCEGEAQETAIARSPIAKGRGPMKC